MRHVRIRDVNQPLPIAHMIRVRLSDGEVVHRLRHGLDRDRADGVILARRIPHLLAGAHISRRRPPLPFDEERVLRRRLDALAIDRDDDGNGIEVRPRRRDAGEADGVARSQQAGRGQMTRHW